MTWFGSEQRLQIIEQVIPDCAPLFVIGELVSTGEHLEDRQARFMNLVVDAMNANIATRKLDLLFGVLHKLVFGLERVAVIWVGALLVLDRSFSVGMLFAFFAYKEQFALRMQRATGESVLVECNAAGIPKGDMKPNRMLMSIRDISGRDQGGFATAKLQQVQASATAIANDMNALFSSLTDLGNLVAPESDD